MSYVNVATCWLKDDLVGFGCQCHRSPEHDLTQSSLCGDSSQVVYSTLSLFDSQRRNAIGVHVHVPERQNSLDCHDTGKICQVSSAHPTWRRRSPTKQWLRAIALAAWRCRSIHTLVGSLCFLGKCLLPLDFPWSSQEKLQQRFCKPTCKMPCLVFGLQHVNGMFSLWSVLWTVHPQ